MQGIHSDVIFDLTKQIIMDKLINIIKKLVCDKFTGTIEINFNQGGIRGIQKITKSQI